MSTLYKVDATGIADAVQAENITPIPGTNEMVRLIQPTSVVNGRVYNVSALAGCATDEGTFPADVKVSVNMRHLADAGGFLVLIARFDGGSNWVELRIGDDTLRLAHVVSGSRTLLGSAYSYAFADNEDADIDLIPIGTSLYARMGGVVVLGPLTTTVTAADEAGYLFDGVLSTTTGNHWKTFEVNDDVSLSSGAIVGAPINRGIINSLVNGGLAR